jgi:hypothetical protein
MKKTLKRSKGNAIVVYLFAVTIGAATLTAGVALGFLINVHSNMHFQPVNGSKANAIATNPGTYAFSGTASGYKQ